MNTTKRYVHKTLGWIALEYFKTGKFYISKVNDDGTEVEIAHNVLPELIGSDRIEVVEKDWKKEVSTTYIESCYNELGIESEIFVNQLVRAIEKHAPKQKKFTRDEVEKFIANRFGSIIGYKYLAEREQAVILFLGKHNLLSSDE